MKNKIFYATLIIALLAFLPAFSGTAQISPEQASATNYAPNSVYNYEGNTVEILEQTDQKTRLLLNDTYQLDLTHNGTYVSADCYVLDNEPLTPLADKLVFGVDFQVDELGQSLRVATPDFELFLDNGGADNEEWVGVISGTPDVLSFTYNTLTREFFALDSVTSFSYGSDELFIIGDYGAVTITKFNETQFIINSSELPGLVIVNWNYDYGYFSIDYVTTGLISGPLPGGFLPIYSDPIISITIDFNGICVSWAGVTLYLHSTMLVLIYHYISITWYFGFLIQRIVFLIWDITIILYLAIYELIIVIIYESIEIKIYETQVVIVYEFIEIIIVFVSIILWEITFIFHFEFWFIQLLFVVQLNVIIINPVRVIFVPVIVPIFISTVYYVPVYINNYVHIYVPCASPALYIDVYNEQLAHPTHTIQYLITDQSGTPIDDAIVKVDYNSTQYTALFVANGVYEVSLPASNETETISVTATKDWYPDGHLEYDLDIDWLIGVTTITETPTAPLPIIPILASLFSLAIGATIIKRRKN
ncbi:MAG: hypothetical protein JXA54_12560 [Candidatus Heimdallarchaeota archaeon]|nr:hypothetical protein [Candidatus Heimdallarchaeota archaeon]